MQRRYHLRFAMQVGHETTYRKVASFTTSRLESHVGFFRLLIIGIFGPYDKKVDFLISNARYYSLLYGMHLVKIIIVFTKSCHL